MSVWLIWVQGYDHVWLEAAWDDDTVSENMEGWLNEQQRVRKLAFENDYEYRIQLAHVPDVLELFETNAVVATL